MAPEETGAPDAEVISEDGPGAADPGKTSSARVSRETDRPNDRAATDSGLPWAGADDRRREIAEAVRRARKGEADPDADEDDEEPPDEAVIEGVTKADEPVETDEDDESPEPAPKPSLGKQPSKVDDKSANAAMQQAAKKVGLDELDDDVTLEITVNGKTVETTVGDLLANAGRYMAGDEHLESAKEILRSARVQTNVSQVSDDGRGGRHQPEPRTSDGSRAPARVEATPAFDRDKLHKIVDAIQGGTVDEGTDALADMLSEAANVATRAATAVTEQDRDDQRIRGLINGALGKTASAFPEIDSDQRLVGLSAMQVNQAMKDRLRTVDDLEERDQLDQMAPMELIRGYTRFVNDPANARYGLPPIDALFSEAATDVYKWHFGKDPDPARLQRQQQEDGPMDDGQRRANSTPLRNEPRVRSEQTNEPVRRTGVRVVRKETLTQQPNPASIKADGTEAPKLSREARHEIAVERLREERQGVRLGARR